MLSPVGTKHWLNKHWVNSESLLGDQACRRAREKPPISGGLVT